MVTSVKKQTFEGIASKIYGGENTTYSGFSQINLAKLAKDTSGNAISCPDQYVGIINIEKNGCVSSWNVGWVEENLSNLSKKDREAKSKGYKKQKLPVLAIVLESPHKEEFDYKNKRAIGPAIGTSGNNLKKYLPQVVFNYLPDRTVDNKIYYAPEDQIPNGKYKVLLINAIQYQCSLGEDTKQYRDKIFSVMWKQLSVRNDFCDRLKSHKPCVVINACTSTGDKDRKSNVQNAINECQSKLNLQSPHPSSWYDASNRRIEKVK